VSILCIYLVYSVLLKHMKKYVILIFLVVFVLVLQQAGRSVPMCL